MSDEQYQWRKMKNADEYAVEKLLRENEEKYVNACGRFLVRSGNDSVWVLSGKKNKIEALVINSRSALMPVLCGKEEIPKPGFLDSFFNRKKIHSVQGLLNEVILMEKYLENSGRIIRDTFDYDLMSLDCGQLTIKSGQVSNKKEISNLVLMVPKLTDLDAISPLQAAYEQEEVLPFGSVFSPAASRINITNIIANGQILAAQLNGRLVGKINVNAVSYTRYQVGGVYVHPGFRGLGIARKMALEFIESLIKQGKEVTLFVKKNNTAARRLYSGMGFNIKGDYRITYY